MSSHHVIRGGQEPPVFLGDEEAAFHPLLPDLLEWSPVLIAMDRAIPALLQTPYKVDHILCLTSDPDQWSEVFGANYVFQAHPVSRETLIPVATQNIIEATGSDRMHAIYSSNVQKEMWASSGNVSVFTREIKWTRVSHGTFRKWMRKGSVIIFEGKCETVRGDVVHDPPEYSLLSDGVVTFSGIHHAWIGEKFNS